MQSPAQAEEGQASGSRCRRIYVSREIDSINLQVGENKQDDSVGRRKAMRAMTEGFFFFPVLGHGDLLSSLLYINPVAQTFKTHS